MNEAQNEFQLQPGTPAAPAAGRGMRDRAVALGFFVLAFVSAVLANIIGGRLGQVIAGPHTLVADLLYRILTTVCLIVFFALLLRYLGRERGSTLAAMGLPLRRGWLKESVWGAAIGFGLVSIAAIAIALFGHLEMHAALTRLAERRLVEVTILLLFGAMMEELMFRGYPFQRLIDAVGPIGSILLFSALFGAVHLSNPNAGGVLSWGFFNTLAIGVVFSIAYLKFRTLWLPWGLHFGWNFSLGVIYGLPVSGLSIFSVVVKSTASGPKLLTGGAYGIESSMTGAVVILIGLGVILALPARPNNLVQFAPESAASEVPAGEPNRI